MRSFLTTVGFLLVVMYGAVQVSCDASKEAAAFYQEADIRGFPLPTDDITIRFTFLLGMSDGLCDPLFATIFLDLAAWEGYGPERRELLVFHELGHCVLGLPHSEFGIMAPEGYEVDTYQNHRRDWIDTMFIDAIIKKGAL